MVGRLVRITVRIVSQWMARDEDTIKHCHGWVDSGSKDLHGVLYRKPGNPGGGGHGGVQNKPRKIIHSEFRWETTRPGRGNRININLVRTQRRNEGYWSLGKFWFPGRFGDEGWPKRSSCYQPPWNINIITILLRFERFLPVFLLLDV